jgi:NAD(P)-dependent dehydrogenase (short-subunit alcohol dehydrogenase family)
MAAPTHQPPPQQQNRQPGQQSEMTPEPQVEFAHYQPSQKLKDQVALITGGDSGIGQAVAALFAAEGAHLVINYLDEHQDARKTQEIVEGKGRRCLTLAGDIGSEAFCRHLIEETVKTFGRLDILVNNAAEQHLTPSIEDISEQQLERTFRTNLFSIFFLCKHALPHLKPGASIINTASVTAYKGSQALLDYSSTKGAIIAFTRSFSQSVVDRGIRVNAVAPGPIWTPLIPASFPAEKVGEFGKDVPMGRAGQPAEVAPCYLFLASAENNYMTGQVLHPNGGSIVNA